MAIRGREMKSVFSLGNTSWGSISESPATRGLRRAIPARWGEGTGLRRWVFPVLLLAVCFAAPCAAHGQTVPEGDVGGTRLTVGAMATGYDLQYGPRKMLGIAAIADIDTERRIGFEGEAQWLMFNQTANVHTTTYLAGPRYHLTYGRFQPYAKGLIGLGEFYYPGYSPGSNLGRDNDFVIAPGAGLDFRITRKIRWRVADFEYQYWPEFHYGALSSYGISTGIRVRLF
jgi:hypothetical protein